MPLSRRKENVQALVGTSNKQIRTTIRSAFVREPYLLRLCQLSPKKLFPHHPSRTSSRGMGYHCLTFSRALCEDFRYFLSAPSITGHCLCEDFPKILFGGSPASESAEKSLFMRKLGDHVRTKKHLFLWHFEGKIQKMRVSRGRLFE